MSWKRYKGMERCSNNVSNETNITLYVFGRKDGNLFFQKRKTEGISHSIWKDYECWIYYTTLYITNTKNARAAGKKSVGRPGDACHAYQSNVLNGGILGSSLCRLLISSCAC